MKLLTDFKYTLIFLVDDRYNKAIFFSDKIEAALKVISTFAPIAFILDVIHLWFANNQHFIAGFCVAVAFNAYYGIKKHRRAGTYDWKIFLRKTNTMLTVVCGTYILLTILSKFGGNNPITEAFSYVVQVMTLFYPTAKTMKSYHELSGGDYPPKWLMRRFYNFEKDGDTRKLFGEKDTDNDNTPIE